MDLKEVKELKKHVSEALAIIESEEANANSYELAVEKALNREAHALNENEKLKLSINEHIADNERLKEALKASEEAKELLEKENAELKAKLEEAVKYRAKSKKPAIQPKSGFRIKEE